MSLFNMLVKPHPLSKLLLTLIRWGQPLDEEKKYPLLGRMRYVWLSEDYKNIKILLKDGPGSWSEEKEEIKKQIEEHETYISTSFPKDDVYLIAEFGMIDSEKIPFVPEDVRENLTIFAENLRAIDKDYVAQGFEPMTKDPFEICDEQMAIMKGLPAGVFLNEEVKDFVTKFKDKLDEKDL